VGIKENNMSFLRLYFLRHGQTVDYQKYLFNGWRDVDLTDQGREQLDQAVLALKGQPIEAVYSSDLKRALYGGTALAKQLGLELIVEPSFREVSFGQCEGLNFQEIRAKFPDLASDILRPDGGEFAFPGGEGAADFRIRIKKALEKLRQTHPQGSVALVCHAGVCRAILAEALELSNTRMWAIDQDFACLNVIDFFSAGGLRIRLVNGFLGPTGYAQPGPGYDRLTYVPAE
jgi:alpha-ribazole phosphatase/probable phosphoglycerate mutase